VKVNVEQEPNKENNGDVYLWVKSKAKALKENSMNGLLSQRFEEGIEAINQGINKKGGTKKLNKVHERLGRIKEKYPSVHKYYDVTITDDGNQTATSIRCEHKKGEDPDKRAGIYFLRTTLDDKNETTLWHIYNVILPLPSIKGCAMFISTYLFMISSNVVSGIASICFNVLPKKCDTAN